jgi:DNA-binding MurR/RpiR family transcriptional regulator
MAVPVGAADLGRTVMVRMRALLPGLTPVEQRVAAQFLADPAGTAALTITELAARCDTSTASVVRFSRHLGYERYRDLRLDVTREATRETLETAGLPGASSDIDRDDSLADIVAKVSLAETLSISDTVSALDVDSLAAAVGAVVRARRVDVFGVGASAVVGLDLQRKLVRIGRTALEWSDSHAAWTSAATLDRDCVAIAISHSGTTTDTIEFLGIARSSGATTVAITNHGASPLAQKADLVLTTAARETAFRSGALGSRIAQLMVVDCLFIGVAQAAYDASMEALRRTYVAVHRARPEA